MNLLFWVFLDFSKQAALDSLLPPPALENEKVQITEI